MTQPIQKLATEFENPHSISAWRLLAKKALGKADFDTTLIRKSEDNIPLGPIFTKAKKTIQIHKNLPESLDGRAWHITAQINHPDIEHANTDMLADLEGGASALSLMMDPRGQYGTAVRSVNDLQRLFSGVHTNLTPIQMVPSTFYHSALLAAYFQNHKQTTDIHLSLSYPHAGGNTSQLLSLTNWVCKNAPHWKAVTINGADFHEDGASSAQELAYILAKSTSILRPLVEAHGLETALGLIDLRLASNQDAHFNIIKFRAARLLWAKLAQSFGAKPNKRSISIRAISSVRMLGKADPWANILRLNAACFGAVCGGADSINLLPFTYLNGLATPFARRISRNLQLMQMDETRLGHVNDPARGSYMHESLTHDLAQKSWEMFQKIEMLGGWKDGSDWFMAEVKTTKKERARKIKDGETLLVGINQHTKTDVRKAETVTHPNIKQRSGKIMDADDFENAISQANAGYLLPLGAQS